MSDNFKVQVVSQEKDHFDKAILMCFDEHKNATHYSVSEIHGMILYWSEPEPSQKAQKLPYDLNSKNVIGFVWGWLQNAKYPDQPDMDGDCEKGFQVSTGDYWGHVNGSFYSICAIKPEWMLYGK